MSEPVADHDVEASSGPSTETWLFLSVGVLTFVIFVLFAIFSNDNGGKALLALTAGFSLVMGGYLFFRDRKGGVRLETDPVEGEPPWFPESSIWPLTVAGGTALTVAGLALGPWIWLPGGLLLIRGLWGFLLQSRHRG